MPPLDVFLRIRSCLLFVLCFTPALSGQDFVRAVAGIPFERNGQILAFPFFGGLDRFLPQFLDGDGDGDLDLFVAEANELNWQLSFFNNRGTPQTPDFHWQDTAYDTLRIGNWFAFADIDTDGDPDLFCANSEDGMSSLGGLRFYRNTGSRAQPRFFLETNELRDSNGEAVASEPTSIPTFADLDADGDLDFFTGVVTGTIRMYRNTGTPAAPVFTFETETWQNLIIISGGRAQSAFAPAQALKTANQHGANGISFVDDDGDGDQDFFYGDLFHKSVYLLRNHGTPQNANVAITDSLFPRPQAVQTNGYNIPRFADLEADGDFDFFAAGIQQGENNFLFYRNIGAPVQPQYRLVSENFLPMIDAGSACAPALADLDADGDRDLLLGDDEGFFIYYRNVGTPKAPALQWVSDNFQNLRPSGFFSAAAPAFVDIDADGDFDLFSGYHFGRIAFFENRGTAQQASFVLVTDTFENIDVGDQSTPHFVDNDRDGDFDLIIGEARRLDLHFYENGGNARQPRFVLKKKMRPPILIDESAPCTYDWNGDGLLDLFVGTQVGTIVYFRGTAQPDSFVLVDEKFAGIDVGFASTPLITDFDGNGKIDLLVGERAGGLNFFRGTRDVAVEEREAIPAGYAMTVYPNPARDYFKITLQSPLLFNHTSPPALTIFNLLGERVAEVPLQFQNNGTWLAEWRPLTFQLAAGIYFAHAKLGRTRMTRKLMWVR